MRRVARCAALAFALTLAVGPGASVALADSAKDKQGHEAKQAKAPVRPAARHTTAKPKAEPKVRPGHKDATRARAHHGNSRFAVIPLTIDAVQSPVASVVITHQATQSVLTLLQLAPPAEGGQPVARHTAALTLGAAHIALPAGGTTRAAARGQALPAQGPASIGGRLSGASAADVPIFVAVIGLLLVTLGARGVGRFRRPDGDTDLTWD